MHNLVFYFILGKPIGADLTCHYLTIFTINGFLKLFDISKHEPKQMIHSKSGYDLFQNFGEFIHAKCNSNGCFIAAIIASESLLPDGHVYIWNIEKDIIASFDFLSREIGDNLKTEQQLRPR